MKLYVSPTSPYGRICLARALLLGRNDLSLQMVDPWQNPPELEAINPLSQIPVLVLDDEKTAVPGTLPICLYRAAPCHRRPSCRPSRRRMRCWRC
ncbi:glutathione S-transferase N-terminal domain-containing protein [Lautropia mirabilis]